MLLLLLLLPDRQTTILEQESYYKEHIPSCLPAIFLTTTFASSALLSPSCCCYTRAYLAVKGSKLEPTHLPLVVVLQVVLVPKPQHSSLSLSVKTRALSSPFGTFRLGYFCHLFFFNHADPRGITEGGLPEFPTQLDIFRRWCQGLFKPQVPCNPSLYCPIANSASTQSQQPV